MKAAVPGRGYNSALGELFRLVPFPLHLVPKWLRSDVICIGGGSIPNPARFTPLLLTSFIIFCTIKSVDRPLTPPPSHDRILGVRVIPWIRKGSETKVLSEVRIQRCAGPVQSGLGPVLILKTRGPRTETDQGPKIRSQEVKDRGPTENGPNGPK
jgi:hypothetical protein